MDKKHIIAAAVIVSAISCSAVFAEKCPDIGNIGVADLIKEGRVLDDEKHTWVRGDVFVVDGKTGQFKSYYPKELYSQIEIVGGQELTEQTDDSGTCIYEADITRHESQPNPKFYKDKVRVKATIQR
ncbi:hypothetical protein Cva_00710 [Caedimonas varicaedens]|uniref:Uncharacterized protein n=1 Tax=Caedimonas varicaedens TaxID=1629334 RepID=A0A0K8MC62_9PROT|nr:hypothetical protein Cva_00710 [Caedimonas varicaedens]